MKTQTIDPQFEIPITPAGVGRRFNAGAGRYVLITEADLLRLEDLPKWLMAHLTTGDMTRGILIPYGTEAWVVYAHFRKGASPLIHLARIDAAGRPRYLVTERRWLRRKHFELTGEKLSRDALDPYEAVRLALLVDAQLQRRASAQKDLKQ